MIVSHLVRQWFPIMMVCLLVTALIAQAQEELSETFTSPESRFVVNYPAGWNVQGAGELMSISNTDDALMLTLAFMFGDSNPLERGEILIDLYGLPAEDLRPELENFDTQKAHNFARAWYFQPELDLNIVEEPITVELAGKRAIAFRTMHNNLETQFHLLDYDTQTYILVRSIANQGDLEQFEDAIESIIESLTYDAPLALGIIETNDSPASPGTDEVIWQHQQESNLFIPEALTSPGPIAVAADDTIYVFDTMHDNIKVFSADGDFVGTIVNRTMSNAIQDMVIAPDGTLWLTDSFEREIYHLDPHSGDIISSIEVGPPGTGQGEFARNSPDGLVIGSDGKLYVFDGQGDFSVNPDGIGRIQVFEQSGQFLYEFPTTPEGTRRFNDEGILAIDHKDHIYMAESSDIRIVDNKGELVGKFTLRDGYDYVSIYEITIGADGNLYVASGNGTIYKFDTTGNLLDKYGQAQSWENGANLEAFALGKFGDIRGLAILSNGDVVATSYNLNYAQVVRFRFP